MTKNKYIALLLVGIFIFPILSLPVHFIRHHQDDVSHCCQDVACHIVPLPDDTDIDVILEGKDICPICEYRFSINTTHVLAVFECVIPKTTWVYIEAHSPLIILPLLTHKSPRAPPVMQA